MLVDRIKEVQACRDASFRPAKISSKFQTILGLLLGPSNKLDKHLAAADLHGVDRQVDGLCLVLRAQGRGAHSGWERRRGMQGRRASETTWTHPSHRVHAMRARGLHGAAALQAWAGMQGGRSAPSGRQGSCESGCSWGTRTGPEDAGLEGVGVGGSVSGECVCVRERGGQRRGGGGGGGGKA